MFSDKREQSLLNHHFVTVKKSFTMHCSHFLSKHGGMCKNMHGHTYEVVIEIGGYVNEETKMLIDTGDLTEIVEEHLINKFDHTNLNDSLGVNDPTMEYMSYKFAEILKPVLPLLTSVTVWETRKSRAKYVVR